MAEELQRTLREVRDSLLSNPVSPRVDEPADINRRYCRFVAETVVERLDDATDVVILEDGGRGYVHTWLAHDGRHFDAECPDGVEDYRDLPFFQRHPEAAIHVEPASTDSASVRHRGEAPLYPDIFAREPYDGGPGIRPSAYVGHAVAGVLLGALVFAVGVSGEWALQHHLLAASPGLQTAFVDAELIGELIVVVAPIIFLVLLPVQRASAR